MLQAKRLKGEQSLFKNDIKINDTIVLKPIITETVEKKDGKTIITQTKSFSKVNLTKKINEQAKFIKIENAQDKLAEIEKIFTKK